MHAMATKHPKGKTKVTFKEREASNANRDPITGAPGAHPVGVGLGATTGATTGALVGAFVAGPVGAVVGGAIGAYAGGLAGKEAGENFVPTVEDTYWRENYYKRAYCIPGVEYKQYAPAYKYGRDSALLYKGQTWDEVVQLIEAGWPKVQYDFEGERLSFLTWPQAMPAIKDAWDRAHSTHDPKPVEPLTP
jgi:hypothetical protein